MTSAGVLSRIIGFFYRIFLSRTIGAEALGIYQLIGPVFSLCFALTASSIQTSISKFVGDAIGGCRDSLCGEKKARAYLILGLVLSCGLSILTGIFMYFNAELIAVRFLGEARCAPLLVLLTYSLLPCCIHACINGYYYGKKNAFVPSLCQLIEQIARVGSVWIIFQITTEKGIPLTAFHAEAGHSAPHRENRKGRKPEFMKTTPRQAVMKAYAKTSLITGIVIRSLYTTAP